MEIILTKNCLDLQGALRSDLGYFIVPQGDKFVSQRTKHFYNPDGHWLFIKLCLDLINTHMYISDVKIHGWELYYALIEYGYSPLAVLAFVELDKDYNAEELSDLIKKHGL